MSTKDAQFVGSIPEIYEKHLVPVIFDPFARDLASRMGPRVEGSVLEIACGTGVLTRTMVPCLADDARLIATDLNEAMLRLAEQRTPRDPRVSFRTADGMALPFPDGAFDRVVCQFGVMFYPDRMNGLREARRVLKPGGVFLFNVWDRFDRNPFGRLAHQTIASFFPQDPPTFYFTPFGFHDPDLLQSLLRTAGFRQVETTYADAMAVAPTARDFATGLVRGNPVAAEIAERGVDADRVVDALEAELAREGGAKPHRSPMRALVARATV